METVGKLFLGFGVVQIEWGFSLCKICISKAPLLCKEPTGVQSCLGALQSS